MADIIEKNSFTTLLWADKSDKTKAILKKSNGDIIHLSIGDFITYTGRPDGVRIDNFTHNNKDDGPIGLTYLPWRKEKQSWATVAFSILRGNPRHLIAWPYGSSHYGEHPDWSSLIKLDKCPDAI